MLQFGPSAPFLDLSETDVRESKDTTLWYVYLLRCSDGTLYAGSTNDLAAREQRHNHGRGAKYTAGRRPVRVVYSEAHESRSAAQSREAEIKRWTRAKKEAVVAGSSNQSRGVTA